MLLRNLAAWIALTIVPGCGSGRSNEPPAAIFDVTGADWTTPIEVARRAVRSTCTATPILSSRFSRCEVGDADVHILDADGRLTLIADVTRLAGYAVDFNVATCTPALSKRIAEHYRVSEDIASKTPIYTIRNDGACGFENVAWSSVRLATPTTSKRSARPRTPRSRRCIRPASMHDEAMTDAELTRFAALEARLANLADQVEQLRAGSSFTMARAHRCPACGGTRLVQFCHVKEAAAGQQMIDLSLQKHRSI